MHDIGRTQQEYLGEQEFQPEVLEAGGLGETYGETGEAFEGGFQEAGFETFESLESPINEALEMELASELLEVTNEQELDRFLGDLIKKVGRAAGKFISSPIGRGLLGVLKPLVKKVLPIAAGAAGSIFGGPLGGLVGSQVSNLATKAFGLELEGMSSEDAQFEVARRAVRLASAATSAAAAAPQAADPRTTAQLAVTTAAQQHAPGLLRAGAAFGGAVPSGASGFAAGGFTQPQGPSHLRRRGIWIRRGRRILLLGV